MKCWLYMKGHDVLCDNRGSKNFVEAIRQACVDWNVDTAGILAREVTGHIEFARLAMEYDHVDVAKQMLLWVANPSDYLSNIITSSKIGGIIKGINTT